MRSIVAAEERKELNSSRKTVQVKNREVSPEGIRVTMRERICERDEF